MMRATRADGAWRAHAALARRAISAFYMLYAASMPQRQDTYFFFRARSMRCYVILYQNTTIIRRRHTTFAQRRAIFFFFFFFCLLLTTCPRGARLPLSTYVFPLTP